MGLPKCGFPTFSGRLSTKMVNWHDPALLLEDYSASTGSRVANIAINNHLVAAIKLHHVIAGIYMCVRLHWQESRH